MIESVGCNKQSALHRKTCFGAEPPNIAATRIDEGRYAGMPKSHSLTRSAGTGRLK